MTRPVLIFDLGGVLVDWDPRYLFDAVIEDPDRRRWFLTHVAGAEFLDQVDRGRPFPETVAEWSRRFPGWADALDAYARRWDETVRGAVPGTEELLRELAAAGAPLFALSNWPADTFWVARRRFAVLEVFGDIVVSGEVGLVKPDPAIYRLALERFGLSPGSCVFVDDRAVNVDGARAVGMRAVRFTDAATLRTDPAVTAWLG